MKSPERERWIERALEPDVRSKGRSYRDRDQSGCFLHISSFFLRAGDRQRPTFPLIVNYSPLNGSPAIMVESAAYCSNVLPVPFYTTAYEICQFVVNLVKTLECQNH